MSALPAEHTPHPYRLDAADGPQTLPELRAALAAVAPADLVTFNDRLDASRLDQVPALLTEYRHVIALRTRPAVADAIAAALSGNAELVPADEVFARYALDETGAA